MTLRFDQVAQETSARFTITYPSGVLAVDAARLTRLVLALHDQANSFVITPRFGPVSTNSLSLRYPPESAESGVRQWYLAAHALELLQSRTSTPLRMPADITSENYEAMTRVVYSAAMLDGQTVILKVPVMCVNREAQPAEDEQLMRVLTPRPVHLPETTIELGPVILTFYGSRTDPFEADIAGDDNELDSDEQQIMWIKVKDGRVEARLPLPEEADQVANAMRSSLNEHSLLN